MSRLLWHASAAQGTFLGITCATCHILLVHLPVELPCPVHSRHGFSQGAWASKLPRFPGAVCTLMLGCCTWYHCNSRYSISDRTLCSWWYVLYEIWQQYSLCPSRTLADVFFWSCTCIFSCIFSISSGIDEYQSLLLAEEYFNNILGYVSATADRPRSTRKPPQFAQPPPSLTPHMHAALPFPLAYLCPEASW